jgi:hypothetical protein
VTALRVALVVIAIAGCATAHAQDGQVEFDSSGVVRFTLSAAAIADASACPGCAYATPDPVPATVLRIRRQNPNRLYTLDVWHDGWSPATTAGLEARYTVTTTAGATLLVTPWLAVGPVATEVFTQAAVGRETQVLARVEYRLLLTADLPAGIQSARVTYAIRENASAVSHDVVLSTPAFVTLRLAHRAAPGVTTVVAFDYAAAPAAYLDAVTRGVPLPVTGGDLDRIEIATNHPRGYRVTVTVDEATLGEGGALLRDRLLLFGEPAHARVLTREGPTAGFITLLDVDDLTLRVDGAEPPGSHTFLVRYDAVPNP